MEIMERDIIQRGVDENGNPTVDFPLARLGWIEDTAEVKAAPGGGDYIPIVDMDANGQIKKTPAAALGGGAARYDEAAGYTEGEYCVKDGKLYRCTTAVSSGAAWDAANWRETSVAKELEAVRAVAGDAVPVSRTVNGKALSANITLSAGDVGAALANHAHTAAQVGASPVNHSHTAAQVGAAALNHTHTAAQVGAAALNHTHTAAQVGAAAINHTHGDLGNARIAYGTYFGTGAYGESSPNRLTFAFVPRVLILVNNYSNLRPAAIYRNAAEGAFFTSDSVILLAGATPAFVYAIDGNGKGFYCYLQYTLGTTTTFYVTPASGTACCAEGQFNAATYYHYIAIG